MAAKTERDAAKAAYQQARDIARQLTVADPCRLKVEDYGTVTRCEGGHFVEAVVWVPDPVDVTKPQQ